MNHNLTSRTAILVFAQSAEAEAKHKAIANTDALFDVLTDHTLKTVEKTGLPYFHINELQQVGTTFGERFANAIQAVYNKGFDRVITIGNDSPQLKAQHITEAECQLKNDKFVLGPSTDGGFYLMGLHKGQFNAEAFKQLAWQTSALSKQLLRLVSVSVAVFRLPTLFDIDTVEDIKSFIAYATRIPNKVLQIFLSILFQTTKIEVHATVTVENRYLKLSYNKGSPQLFQSA